MMGSASGVDHTFDYGMNSLELYLGKKKNYFEGNVIYAEDDYKHNGDFILEYYVKKKYRRHRNNIKTNCGRKCIYI